MQRALWIVGGSIILAAVIVAVALGSLNKDEVPTPREQPGIAGAAIIGAEQRAQDRAAQSSLRNAMAVAKVYFVDNESYSGFDPDWAVSIEPSLVWTADAPAAVDVVTINLARDGEVVMSTMSASGQPFCIADSVFGSAAGTEYGRIDAYGAADTATCAGGW